MPTRRQLLAALVASVSSTAVVGAKADTWPSRPVRVIVPYPPGGSSDITARFVAESVSRTLGQRFFIDNRPGAGGNVGMEAAAQSSPDGYTVVLGTTAHAINMTLFKNLNYNTLTSFIPVALLTEMPLILVANLDVPARTIAELIALAKAKPRALNYASSGNGQSTHLAAELFASMAGIQLTHVPYRGSAPRHYGCHGRSRANYVRYDPVGSSPRSGQSCAPARDHLGFAVASRLRHPHDRRIWPCGLRGHRLERIPCAEKHPRRYC